MIKDCIFNKSNDVSGFDIFKKFLECINSKISLTCCTETGAIVHCRVKQKLYVVVEVAGTDLCKSAWMLRHDTIR